MCDLVGKGFVTTPLIFIRLTKSEWYTLFLIYRPGLGMEIKSLLKITWKESAIYGDNDLAIL
jgi:hypothetical protein